jgi:hypothetical protein
MSGTARQGGKAGAHAASKAPQGLLDWSLAALLGAAAFGLYVSTLAPTVLAGDAGEFQFVPYLLGVAHPTGYPLYCLLGWAWSHLLSLRDVAYRMNLFSAFWTALAVGLFYGTARALLQQALPDLKPLAGRLLAVLAAAILAVTPTLWSQAVIAEVYGLHSFLVVLLLYLVLTWSERRGEGIAAQASVGQGRRWLLLAALAFGLGLAHHRTIVLLAPGVLAYVWLTDRRMFREGRRVGMPGLVLALLPLALYLYIPWRAPRTAYLHLPLTAGRDLVLYQNSASNLIRFVLGGPFGAAVDLSVDLGARLAMAWGFVRNELGWVGIALAGIGVARLAAGRRWALLTLTGLAAAATLAFNLVYTIGDIFVLYIPFYLIAVLWLAVGVGALASLLREWRVMSVLVVVPFFALPLWLAVAHYPAVDQSDNTRASARWEAILAEPLPPRAVLVSNDRNNMMAMWYLQTVDGERTDLLGLFPLITPEYPTLGSTLDLALSTGRPTYLIKEMPGVEIKVSVEPEGLLWHVLGPAAGDEPAYPLDVQLAGAVALTGYDRSPSSPRPGETLEVSLYWEALRPLDAEYHTYVHLVDPSGQMVAQDDRQPGGAYYPSTLWQPGERLRDVHRLTVPSDVPAGTYSLEAGVYSFARDGGLVPLGEPVVIGQIEM